MRAFPDKLLLDAWAPDRLRRAGYDHAFYTVAAPFRYESKRFGIITVLPGTVTDFASIPRIVWNLLDPEDPVIEFPSVVHDCLYKHRGRTPERVFTREEVDQVLSEAMGVCGASKWQRWAVYHAVRTFGGSHWTA